MSIVFLQLALRIGLHNSYDDRQPEEDVAMALKQTETLNVIQPSVGLSDPHVLGDNKDRRSIVFAMYESLVQRDERGVYRPCLATNWAVQTDARTWTFNIRKDVLFHNGDKLKAEDVVASLERARDPSLGGELGTQGVYRSYLGDAVIKELNEHSVRIVTGRPMSDLLDLLVDLPIVPQQALDGIPDTPIGSGPYRFEEARSGAVQMEAFAQHWMGKPAAEHVYWRAEPDERSRIIALLADEADIISGVTVEGRRVLEGLRNVSFTSVDSNMCVIFMCNLRSGLCTDRRVRQALNYSLDKSEIIRSVKDGAAQPLNGPLTPLHLGYDSSTAAYQYDPERAKTLLADSGHPNGIRIVLDVPTTLPDEAPQLAHIMAEYYAKVRIETEIKEFADREAYAEMVRLKRIHDACCFDSSPFSTYRVLREKFHSGVRGPWWQGYINRTVDALIDQAQATMDDIQRREIYRRAYRMIRDDAPWIFLYSPIAYWGVGPRARGWKAGVDCLVRLH